LCIWGVWRIKRCICFRSVVASKLWTYFEHELETLFIHGVLFFSSWSAPCNNLYLQLFCTPCTLQNLGPLQTGEYWITTLLTCKCILYGVLFAKADIAQILFHDVFSYFDLFGIHLQKSRCILRENVAFANSNRIPDIYLL
jgi:hypothetical protein